MAHVKVVRRSMRPEEWTDLRFTWLQRGIWADEEEITGLRVRDAHQISENAYEFVDGEERPLNRGDMMFTPDGTAFIRGTANIPERFAGQRVYLRLHTAAEMIVRVNGKLVGGIDPNRDAILLTPYIDRPELTIEIEAYNRSKPDDERNPASLSTRGCRQIFEGAFLCTRRDNVQSLVYDYILFMDMAHSEYFNEDLRRYLFKELSKALDFVDFDTFEGVDEAARYVEEKIYQNTDFKGSGDVALVAHSHLDIAYYWRRIHAVQKNARTILIQLRLMDRYPEFRYTHTQAYTYETLEKYYPELFKELSARVEERLSRENTIVYTACTQPTDRLYVSWPTAGETRPSFLVERLSYLFPQCVVQPEPPLAPDRLITLAAEVPEARAALAEDYGEAFFRLDRAAGWSRGKLSPQAVRRLYGEKVAMSASRMDKYKSCHFAYFLQYGLAARPRRRAGFDAPEYGTFVHYVLEHVLKAAKVRGGVPSCSDEEIRGLTRQAVSEYVHTQLGGMEHQTPRFKYLFRRLQAGVQAVVDNVIDELRASDFHPILFELGFGSGQDLPPVEVKSNGITLRISGFVDRVDGWEKDGRLYVRVVDYKTGRKSFDLTEVWNGLGLQMLLYLFTLEERGEALLGTQPTPAGVLYLPARDALVSGSRAMEATQRQALLDKELVRRGLVLDDEEVIQAMEHGEGGMRFLPLKVSARTGAISGDALVTAEKLGRLRRHTRHILEDICKEIAAGNIDADPFWRGPAKNACQYCDYVQVCQFEEDRDRRRWSPTVRSGAFGFAIFS